MTEEKVVLQEGDDGWLYWLKSDGTKTRTVLRTERSYGRSPAMEALPALRAWDAMPMAWRMRLAAAWVRSRLYG